MPHRERTSQRCGPNGPLGTDAGCKTAICASPYSQLKLAMQEARRSCLAGPRPGAKLGLGWMTMTRGPLTLVGLNGGTAGYSTLWPLTPKHARP